MKLYNKTNLESLQLPPDFERISARELKEIIGYGKGYNGYRFCNEETIGLVTCSEGKKNEIPYSAQALIKELHKAMEENEGLIEVKEGTSEKGNHYIYLIRKEREGDAESFFASIAYTMQMCIAKNNRHLYVDSKFFEDGLSGGRDAAVFGVFFQVQHTVIGTVDGQYRKLRFRKVGNGVGSQEHQAFIVIRMFFQERSSHGAA